MIVDHSSVHDHNTQVFTTDTLNMQLVRIAVAKAQWLGLFCDPNVDYGTWRKGCDLFTFLYTLYKVVQRVFIRESVLPPAIQV